MRHLMIIFCVVLLLSGSVTATCAAGENYGRIRALKRRAATVIRQKNDFVIRVLDAYGIDYKHTKEGVVARLLIGGEWIDIEKIEIVPVMREARGVIHLAGHEIFFYTGDRILHLVSNITVR